MSTENPQIKRLLDVQEQQNILQTEFEKKVLELELEYEAKFAPLYAKRAEIIKGTSEDAEPIPQFWLTVFKNNYMLGEMITEADEPALASLSNITYTRLEDNHSFRLEFEFEKNSFFTNPILAKTFYFAKDEEGDSYRFDRIEGTTIDWIPGSNFTVKMVKKTQRHKTKNITRVIEREEKVESFFNFFDPVPSSACCDHENEEEVDGHEHQASDEAAYQLEVGDYIRSKIIPEATNWYLGIAEDDTAPVDYEDFSDFDEENNDESNSEDDDNEQHRPSGSNRKSAQDCKQQ